MALNYILPNGSMASNMEEARKYLKLSAVAFRSLVRQGVVKKITEQQKIQMQQGYEKNKK